MRNLLIRLIVAGLALASSVLAQERLADRPVLEVPDINGLAITLVKPAFPESAVVAGADGATVTLKVVVDEGGSVISAQCSTTCHPMLKDAAELAALNSKFKPQVREGRPVSYRGVLVYTFVVSHINWYRFGTALESTRQFDNISLGPVAQILSSDFATERSRLLSLDSSGGADYETRQKVMAEVVGSVRSRLKGIDLWRFEIGMALRRVTFWAQAGEKTDRIALQKAIDELPTHIASAPETVPEQMIATLTSISKYRVRSDIPERELRQAIGEFSRKIIVDIR